MKLHSSIRLAFVLALGVYSVSAVKAQNLSPSTLGNISIDLNIQGGNGLGTLATSGTATATFTPSGNFAFLDTTGNVAAGQYGTYSYRVTGSATAQITYNQSGDPTEVMNLNFTTLLSGTYTASAAGGTAFGTFTLGANDTSGPLINISNLLTLSAGQTVTAGFVVGGPIPRRVLIRAIGPTLSKLSVGNAIKSTRMNVYSGTQLIGSNAGWSGAGQNVQALQGAFASTGAFALPVGSNDSALLLVLAPGAYTCAVAGQTSTDAGGVLIEVYFAP